MSKLSYLENEIKNLNYDARNDLMSRLLAAESDRLADKRVPLDFDHREVVREEQEEALFNMIACGALAAGVVALVIVFIRKLQKEAEKAAAKEKAKLEADRKAMIQKLSRIKGRA